MSRLKASPGLIKDWRRYLTEAKELKAIAEEELSDANKRIEKYTNLLKEAGEEV